jgi:uncharacterized protein
MPLCIPDLGLGLCFGAKHLPELLRSQAKIDLLEINSDEFIGRGRFDREARRLLDKVADQYPLVMHGISLSIASCDPLDLNYLRALRDLSRDVGARWISDHLCWTGVNGLDTHLLLPVPRTEEMLQRLIDRTQMAQDVLGRCLILENPSAYFEFWISTMSEWEFLGRLAEQSGCQLLLDINNVYVSSRNLGFDPVAYLNGIPVGSVAEIHLGGHAPLEKYILDTHDRRVSDEVWSLYGHACRRLGAVTTVLEWDNDVPSVEVLEDQLAVAREVRQGRLFRAGLPELHQAMRHATAGTGPARPLFELKTIQEAVQQMIVGYSEISTRFMDHDAGLVDQLVRPQDGITIYAKAYHTVCVRVLRDRYRLLSHFIPREFEALVRDYLGERTSEAASRLTTDFDRHLCQQLSVKDTFPDMVHELAAFDKALSLATDLSMAGPSTETWQVNEFADLGDGKIQAVPSLQLLSLQHASYLPMFCQYGNAIVRWRGRPTRNIAIYARDEVLHAEFLDQNQLLVMRRLVAGASQHQILKEMGCDWFETVNNWCHAWVRNGLCQAAPGSQEEQVS